MSADVSSVQEVPQDPNNPVNTTSNQNVGAPVTGSTLISTMAQLQQLAPPLYEAIQESIFMQIKREQDKANADMHKKLQEQDQ